MRSLIVGSFIALSVITSIRAEERRPIVVVQMANIRTGYGDIASNLMMAKSLRKELPSVDIVLDTHFEPYFGRLGDLVPELDTRDSFQSVDRLAFTGPRFPWREGFGPDVLVVFSHPYREGEGVKQARLWNAAKHIVLVTELNEMSVGPYSYSQSRDKPLDGHDILILPAGSSGVGFYDYQNFLPIIPRHQLYETLKKEIPWLPEAFRDPATGVSMVYAANKDLQDYFIGRLLKYQNGKKALTFSSVGYGGFKSSYLNFGQAVVPYRRLSFEMSYQLFAHSTEWNLVTGDQSYAMAASLGKPFIYEMHSWKSKLVADPFVRIPQGHWIRTSSNKEVLANYFDGFQFDIDPQIIRERQRVISERSMIKNMASLIRRLVSENGTTLQIAAPLLKEWRLPLHSKVADGRCVENLKKLGQSTMADSTQ